MYSVAVKIEGLEKRRRSTGLVHAIIGFFLLLKSFDLYFILAEQVSFLLLSFAAVAVVSLAYAFLRKTYDPRGRQNAALRLLQCVAFISFAFLMYRLGRSTVDYLSLFLWAIIAGILFYSEKKLFAETVLTFTVDGVLVPGSYREHRVDWSELEAVTVRHDFITLFHRGKKYLQFQVMQDLSELEVVKMNAFCGEQIGLQNNAQAEPSAVENKSLDQ